MNVRVYIHSPILLHGVMLNIIEHRYNFIFIYIRHNFTFMRFYVYNKGIRGSVVGTMLQAG
jgi:hypothetical protein